MRGKGSKSQEKKSKLHIKLFHSSIHRFILNVLENSAPLHALKQHNATWALTDECQTAFDNINTPVFKGVVDCFFLGLIVFMGCSLACVHACFFLKRIIFHIISLYSTPLCPFSDKRLDLFPGFMKLLLQKHAMGSDWLAGSLCCDWLNCLNVPPLTSVACAPVEL